MAAYQELTTSQKYVALVEEHGKEELLELFLRAARSLGEVLQLRGGKPDLRTKLAVKITDSLFERLNERNDSSSEEEEDEGSENDEELESVTRAMERIGVRDHRSVVSREKIEVFSLMDCVKKEPDQLYKSEGKVREKELLPSGPYTCLNIAGSSAQPGNWIGVWKSASQVSNPRCSFLKLASSQTEAPCEKDGRVGGHVWIAPQNRREKYAYIVPLCDTHNSHRQTREFVTKPVRPVRILVPAGLM